MLGVFIMVNRVSIKYAIKKAIEDFYNVFIHKTLAQDRLLSRVVDTYIGDYRPTYTHIVKDIYGWYIKVYADAYEEIEVLTPNEKGVFEKTGTEWKRKGNETLVEVTIHERKNPHAINVPPIGTYDCKVYIKPNERPNIWTMRKKLPVRFNGGHVAMICNDILDAIEKAYPRMKYCFKTKYSDEKSPVSLFGYMSFPDVRDWVFLDNRNDIVGRDKLIDLSKSLTYLGQFPEEEGDRKLRYYGQTPESIKQLDAKIERMDLELLKTLFFEHNIVSRSILRAYNGYLLPYFIARGEPGNDTTIQDGVNNIVRKTSLDLSNNGYDVGVNYVKLRHHGGKRHNPFFRSDHHMRFTLTMHAYGTLLFIDQTGCFCRVCRDEEQPDSKSMSLVYWLMNPKEVWETINGLKRKEFSEWLEI